MVKASKETFLSAAREKGKFARIPRHVTLFNFLSHLASTMTDVGQLRQRKKEEENKNGNGSVPQAERDGNSDPEFSPRESPLTVLLNSSPHIRAIYHIFIAILIILLLDTLIYDLIERGK